MQHVCLSTTIILDNVNVPIHDKCTDITSSNTHGKGINRMNKLLLLALVCAVFTANAGDFTLQFFAASYHPTSSEKMNGKHKLLGIEYIEDNIGYSLSTFDNSYSKQSVMYMQSFYIENYNQHYKIFLSAGVTSGYKNTGGICLLEVGDLCSIFGVGIVFTTYDARPRITLLGEALVFSLEYKW